LDWGKLFFLVFAGSTKSAMVAKLAKDIFTPADRRLLGDLLAGDGVDSQICPAQGHTPGG
jgi:hypothetical protein